MDLLDVQVLVGGRAYMPNYYDWEENSHDDFPRIVVDATLSPYKLSSNYKATQKTSKPLTIKDVIFNPPATIVFWSDNTKTVVKCDMNQEMYDPEKGMAMAFTKKLMGDNKFEYYNTFLHWLKKWEKQKPEAQVTKTEETVRNPKKYTSSTHSSNWEDERLI